MKLVKIVKSSKADKKLDAHFITDKNRTKIVSFGSAGMDDFTKTKDVEQKARYLQRHSANENWNSPLTAGFWAKNILWNKPTVGASLADTKRRFNL